jgi:hypothetical protein
MNKPYQLQAGDCAGPFIDQHYPDFRMLLANAAAIAAVYPKALLVAFNNDNACCCTNGLTEDEDEAFSDAVWRARHEDEIAAETAAERDDMARDDAEQAKFDAWRDGGGR